jgi:hypothetical protein
MTALESREDQFGGQTIMHHIDVGRIDPGLDHQPLIPWHDVQDVVAGRNDAAQGVVS